MDAPSPNGHDGRDARGRFIPGHKGGPGNPFAKRSAAIRTAFLEAISPRISRPSCARWWRRPRRTTWWRPS